MAVMLIMFNLLNFSQVVAKIIKHCHEEGSSAVDVAQGVLLGLVADSRLEVTNCFPFPKCLDENFDEEDYQMEMMRHLRKVNVDHLHVGWYQSTQQGAFLSTQFLESQFTYQTSIEESVVLIYGSYYFFFLIALTSSSSISLKSLSVTIYRSTEDQAWISALKSIPFDATGCGSLQRE